MPPSRSPRRSAASPSRRSSAAAVTSPTQMRTMRSGNRVDSSPAPSNRRSNASPAPQRGSPRKSVASPARAASAKSASRSGLKGLPSTLAATTSLSPMQLLMILLALTGALVMQLGGPAAAMEAVGRLGSPPPPPARPKTGVLSASEVLGRVRPKTTPPPPPTKTYSYTPPSQFGRKQAEEPSKSGAAKASDFVKRNVARGASASRDAFTTVKKKVKRTDASS